MLPILKKFNLFILLLAISSSLFAQNNLNNSKFKQLYEELPTPNVYRTASGAPGHEYYQQKADYEINVELDEEKNIINGNEVITYTIKIHSVVHPLNIVKTHFIIHTICRCKLSM